MRIRRAIPAALALAAASCAGRPLVRIASSPTGGYCATVGSRLPPTGVRPQLLFASAEATLGSGYRYFRITAYSESSQPGPPLNPMADSDRHGRLCFEVLSGRGSLENTYDAVQVIQQSSPDLQRRLDPTARRRLGQVTETQVPPGK